MKIKYALVVVICILFLTTADDVFACEIPPCKVLPNEEVVAIYIPFEHIAVPVEQQPPGDSGYVTKNPIGASQYQGTSDGVYGILAHNYLAGKEFYYIKLGQMVVVHKGDGNVEYHFVNEIREFQKHGNGNSSSYRDLETDEVYSAIQIHDEFYHGEPHVALQACIGKDGDIYWGIRFVVAKPLRILPRLSIISIRRW